MADYVQLGMVVPEEEGVGDISWTPVDRETYSQDMRLSGDDLLRQVEADVPRIDIQLSEKGSSYVRVHDGELFASLIYRMFDLPEAEDVLRVCTQTVLAQPLRALHEAASGYIFCENREKLSVRVRFEDSGVRVVVTKGLIMRDGDTLEKIRSVRILVEFHTRKDNVFVGIS